MLPSEDAHAYRAHIAAYHSEYQPVGHRESELVQSLADTQWRLSRIPALEMALYAKGRLELADSVVATHDTALHSALLDPEIHLRYEKQLRNLQLQECRLHRRYTQEAAELRRLQAERKEQARAAAEQDRQAATATAATKPSVTPPTDGFVFSSAPAHAATAAEPAPLSIETVEKIAA